MHWTNHWTNRGEVDRAKLGALDLEVEPRAALPEEDLRAYANWFVGGPDDEGAWQVEGVIYESGQVPDARAAARSVCAATAREMLQQGVGRGAGGDVDDRPVLGELGNVYVTLAAVDVYRDTFGGQEEQARRELTRLLLQAKLKQGERLFEAGETSAFRLRSRTEARDLTAFVARQKGLLVVVRLTARHYKPRRA